ncbi:MAG: ComF family protein [Lachnospiraceae bacterium]
MRIRFFETVQDMLFPRRCPVCHEIIVPAGRRICADCERRLVFVTEPYCIKCGKPVRRDEEEYCRECKGKEQDFTEGRAVFVYDEVMKKSIYRFKYGGRQEYAGFYAQEIERCLGGKIRKWDAQALIPIPLHKSRLSGRGYNQAELIAKELQKLTGIPSYGNFMKRIKRTAVQKNLNAFERENNLKKAFKIERNDVKLKSVILIDDIYTTGSTINAAARCLRQAGITNIYFIVLSIGKAF